MKLKTHSGAKKRVKITGTGKVMLSKIAKRHLLANKSRKAKGRNKYGLVIGATHADSVKAALPYKG